MTLAEFVRRTEKGIRWGLGSDSSAARFARFALVGGTSGLVFAAVTGALVHLLAVDPKIASIGGYLASMPVNFVGNRSFSFRSQGALAGDVIRFTVLHCANMALTAGAMATAFDYFGLHYLVGVLAAIILVPVANFLAMSLWVFRKGATGKSHRVKVDKGAA